MLTAIRLLCCFLFLAPLAGQDTAVTSADFAPLGGLYSGTLTYTDYQSDELVAMPLVANIVVNDKRVDLWIEINENDRRYPQDMSLKLKDGQVQGWTIERNAIDSEGVLVLTTNGRDDNRPAQIRQTLAGSETGLLITKEVRFLDEGEAADYFVRNQYVLERLAFPAGRTPEYRAATNTEAGVANVTIPARQEFVLGEAADYAFKANLQNLSGLPVEIRVVDSGSGERASGFGLGNYGKARIEAAANQKVLLVNANDRPVTIRVGLSRNVEGMRYQPIEQ